MNLAIIFLTERIITRYTRRVKLFISILYVPILHSCADSAYVTSAQSCGNHSSIERKRLFCSFPVSGKLLA